MIDPFDLGNAPIGEPLAIAIGTSSQWRKAISLDDSEFSLKYAMRRYTPGAALTQEIVLDYYDAVSWSVDIEPSDIALFETGKFFWDLIVTRNSDSREKILEIGEIQVFATDADRRSHAQIMLDKIESLLSGKADDDVANYSIKSRSITKMSPDELVKWRDYYRREISNSTPLIGMTPVKKSPSSLRVRFTD